MEENGKSATEEYKESLLTDKRSTEEAAKSITNIGKGSRLADYITTNYNTSKISCEYGGESGSDARYKYSAKLYSNIDSDQFTSAGAFSQSGETNMQAGKRYTTGEDVKMPSVIFHIDDVVHQINGFGALQNLSTEAKKGDESNFNRASAYVNGVVSIQTPQLLFTSTTGNANPTKSASYVNPIMSELCETDEGNYGQYGFETKEGVEVSNVYEDVNRELSALPKVLNQDIFTSHHTYVIEYSDGTIDTFDVVETTYNHDSIGKAGVKEIAPVTINWLQKVDEIKSR